MKLIIPRLTDALLEADGALAMLWRRWFEGLAGTLAPSTSSGDAVWDIRLSNAVVDGLTITGTDAGSDASITISAHSRLIDGRTIAYAAGDVTGLAYSTAYYVYVDDRRANGSDLAYGAATAPDDLASRTNRFLLGTVTTPAALGSDTAGTNAKALWGRL